MLIRSPALQRLWTSCKGFLWVSTVCVCVCLCVCVCVSVCVKLAWVSRATPPCTGQSHTTWNPHGWHSSATLKAGWWTNLSFLTQGIHIPLKVRAPGPSWEEPSISGVRQSLQPPHPYIEWLLHRWVCDMSPPQLAWRKRTLPPPPPPPVAKLLLVVNNVLFLACREASLTWRKPQYSKTEQNWDALLVEITCTPWSSQTWRWWLL